MKRRFSNGVARGAASLLVAGALVLSSLPGDFGGLAHGKPKQKQEVTTEQSTTPGTSEPETTESPLEDAQETNPEGPAQNTEGEQDIEGSLSDPASAGTALEDTPEASSDADSENKDELEISEEEEPQKFRARAASVDDEPRPGYAKIVAYVGGERMYGKPSAQAYGGAPHLTDKSPKPLQGVTLRLFESASRALKGLNPNAWHWGQAADQPINAPWATCVSDENGVCIFEIPIDQPGGAPSRSFFWVGQTEGDSIPGYQAQTHMRVGASDANPSYLARYAAVTPYLYSETVVHAGKDFMKPDPVTEFRNNPRSSLGIFEQINDNPPLPQRCGLKVAMVVDLSGSVGRASAVGKVQKATDDFITALEGTDSYVSQFTFSDDSPAQGLIRRTQNHPELQSVKTAEGATTARSWNDKWGSFAGTNWDAGLEEALLAQSARSVEQRYDAVVFITDGNPTRNRRGIRSDGTTNGISHVEAAMATAGALKEMGTRVIAVGVGPGLWGDNERSKYNLESISGKNIYSPRFYNSTSADYFMLSEFDGLSDALNELASGYCKGVVTVEKKVEENGELRPGGEGWEFRAENPNGVTVVEPHVRVTERDSSSVIFPLGFATPDSSGALEVHENLEDPRYKDYELVTQSDGSRATCVDRGTIPAQRILTSNVGDTGFRIGNVKPSSRVHCVVVNRKKEEPIPPINLIIEKIAEDANGGGQTVPPPGTRFMLNRIVSNEENAGKITDPIQIDNVENVPNRFSAVLTTGSYELVEEVSPAGYSLLAAPIHFDVYFDKQARKHRFVLAELDQGVAEIIEDEGGAAFRIRVINYERPTLPRTGGSGVGLIALLGVLIVVVGAAVALRSS